MSYQKKISRMKNVDLGFVNQAYNDTLILSASLNMTFDKILLLTFMILAGAVLCNAYDLTFKNIYNGILEYVTTNNLLICVFSFDRRF